MVPGPRAWSRGVRWTGGRRSADRRASAIGGVDDSRHTRGERVVSSVALSEQSLLELMGEVTGGDHAPGVVSVAGGGNGPAEQRVEHEIPAEMYERMVVLA